MSGDFGGSLELNAMARRLRELVRKSGGNQKVADESGVPLSTLNTIIAGRTDPRVSTLKRLAPALGVGVSELIDEMTEPPNMENRIPSSAVLVPLRDIYASAGPGATNDDESPSRFLAFDPYFVEEWGVPPDRVEAIIARGDSMEPTIMDKAVVLIDRGDRQLRERKVFAFRTADGLRLKRFQRAVDGAILLVSDNQALYAPERIAAAELGDLRIAGRAFWTEREI